MNILPLRSFRLVCKAPDIPLVEALLHAQGFRFEAEPFSAFARKLLHEPIPLGSSLAAVFGYIYIQDRSSMLPPLALSPAPGDAVLDMCASPGSKTGLLGQLVGPEGFVLGNEPSRNRLATLRRNLTTLNLFNCATTSNPGERLPLPAGRWPRILLDPPCSGWGTVEKNPKVLTLWQGDKVKPLITLQRRLLAEAQRLLLPGGTLIYSTCTTNVAENEEQLRYAQGELGLEFCPLAPLPGFAFADPALPEFAGALRVEAGGDGQGFFVALLRKPAEGAALADVSGTLSSAASTDTFVERSAAAQPGEEGVVLAEEQFPISRKGRPSFGQTRRSAGGRKRESALPSAGPEYLSREALLSLQAGAEAGSWIDLDLLPPGDIGVFSDVAHFLPALSRALVPQGFAWKGFPLGRSVAGGVRVNPALHGLMPSRDKARQLGLTCVDIDEAAPIQGMLTGQSLAIDTPASECGLYFRGLPLCRLTVKGRRAILPPL